MITERYILTTTSADRVGIVAAMTSCLSRHQGFIHELAQFGTPTSAEYFSRICFTIPKEKMQAFHIALDEVAKRLELQTKIIPEAQKMRTLVLVSQFDHCLNDLLYRHTTGSLNIVIPAVVSNHDTHRAQVEALNIPYHHIPITKETKPQAEAALKEIINATNAELIILARYMQILSDRICREYSGQIINIHHSFLPGFKGARPYHHAHERGVKLIGATAHYVTSDLDEGPIIEQMVTRIDHSMTPSDLIARGRDIEAQTLARAIKLHSEHRAFINNAKTVILP